MSLEQGSHIPPFLESDEMFEKFNHLDTPHQRSWFRTIEMDICREIDRSLSDLAFGDMLSFPANPESMLFWQQFLQRHSVTSFSVDNGNISFSFNERILTLYFDNHFYREGHVAAQLLSQRGEDALEDIRFVFTKERAFFEQYMQEKNLSWEIDEFEDDGYLVDVKPIYHNYFVENHIMETVEQAYFNRLSRSGDIECDIDCNGELLPHYESVLTRLHMPHTLYRSIVTENAEEDIHTIRITIPTYDQVYDIEANSEAASTVGNIIHSLKEKVDQSLHGGDTSIHSDIQYYSLGNLNDAKVESIQDWFKKKFGMEAHVAIEESGQGTERDVKLTILPAAADSIRNVLDSLDPHVAQSQFIEFEREGEQFSMDGFEDVVQLGKGAYGKVCRARATMDKEVYFSYNLSELIQNEDLLRDEKCEDLGFHGSFLVKSKVPQKPPIKVRISGMRRVKSSGKIFVALQQKGKVNRGGSAWHNFGYPVSLDELQEMTVDDPVIHIRKRVIDQGKEYAIKECEVESGGVNQGHIRALAVEVLKQMRIRHPNVLSAKKVGFHFSPNGISFKGVLDYVSGSNLEDARHTFPSDLVKRREITALIGASMALGIHEVNKFGEAHQDIKPENTMLAVEGERMIPKIIDFGLQGIQKKERHIYGTALYMSPDQVDSENGIRESSDLYNLGSSLWEILTGSTVFSRFQEAEENILDQVRTTPPKLDIQDDVMTYLLLKILEKKEFNRTLGDNVSEKYLKKYDESERPSIKMPEFVKNFVGKRENKLIDGKILADCLLQYQFQSSFLPLLEGEMSKSQWRNLLNNKNSMQILLDWYVDHAPERLFQLTRLSEQEQNEMQAKLVKESIEYQKKFEELKTKYGKAFPEHKNSPIFLYVLKKWFRNNYKDFGQRMNESTLKKVQNYVEKEMKKMKYIKALMKKDVCLLHSVGLAYDKDISDEDKKHLETILKEEGEVHVVESESVEYEGYFTLKQELWNLFKENFHERE